MDFSVSKKDLIRAGILLVVCSLLVLFHLEFFTEGTEVKGNTLIMAYMLLGCYLQSVKIEIKKTALKWAWILVSLLAVPYMMVGVAEYLSGQTADLLDKKIFLLNYLWVLAVYLFLFALTNHYRFSMIFVTLFLYIVNVVNFFILRFRGNPLQVTDVLSVGTAANVAGNYVLELHYELLLTGAFLFFLLSLVSIPDFHQKRRSIRSVGASVVLLAFLIVAGKQFYTDELWLRYDIAMNFWNPLQGYHENGTMLSMAMGVKYIFPEKPDDYSPKRADAIVKEYTKETPPDIKKDHQVDLSPSEAVKPGEPAEQLKEKPNVIAIMNESFADLSIEGDFETTRPYMENFYSLKDNTVRGNLSVNVFGGGTCNSELEFLTGLNTSFLPSGTMAYQQYVREDLHSLATVFREQGYRSIAFHPGKVNSWRRDEVYPLLGFEEFITEKDMENREYMRGVYVTDQCDYREVIKLYEENKKQTDKKLFLFNVTIQNHGGYRLDTVGIPDWVKLKSGVRFPEMEEYMSIMRASDKALKELITYFENQEEPTLIVFFGDHHPSVEVEFEEMLMGTTLDNMSMEQAQKRYQVPFFIWANYDLEETYYDNVSSNYLPVLTLKAAGAELPPYFEYLDGLCERVPMINNLGYQDHTGKYHSYGEETQEESWIEEYKVVQYNALFDYENRKNELFHVKHSRFGEGKNVSEAD